MLSVGVAGWGAFGFVVGAGFGVGLALGFGFGLDFEPVCGSPFFEFLAVAVVAGASSRVFRKRRRKSSGLPSGAAGP